MKKIYTVVFAFWTILSGAYSSESDPYTYSHIKLNDSSTYINSHVQNSIDLVIKKVNQELSLIGHGNISDNEIEVLFMKTFQKHMRYAPIDKIKDHGLEGIAIGDIEGCITSNDCPKWPFIERIILKRGESIYDKVDYNFVTTEYLAPIINFCGNRVGADKLTHFLEDGFRFYNLWANGRSMEDVELLSWREEQFSMGKGFTEIMSFSDVYANVSGVNFYKAFFTGAAPLLKLNSKGLIVRHKDVDLCEFTSDLWDERNPLGGVRYTGKKKTEIYKFIKNQDFSSDVAKESILCRGERAKEFSLFDLDSLIVTFRMVLGGPCGSSDEDGCGELFYETFSQKNIEIDKRKRDFNIQIVNE